MQQKQYTFGLKDNLADVRPELQEYFNREMINLGNHHDAHETHQYFLREGVGVKATTLYAELNQNNPLRITIDLSADTIKREPSLEAIMQRIEEIKKDSIKQ